MKRYGKLILAFLCISLAVFCLPGCEKITKSEDNKKVEKTEEVEKTEKAEKIEEVEKTEEAKETDIPSPSVCGKLSVKGTQLMDENGEAVQLRGLSTHGLASFPQYVNEELFSQFRREWKANVIRLAMYTAESGGYCLDGDKEDLKNLIRSGVEYATNQDMYVIVDWHILSDYNPNQHKADAIEFFSQVSKEFSNHNNVIYEICNEPNGGTSWAEIKSYAQEVIPVIRENSPDAVILVGTPNWSQYVNEAAADPITDYDNIMYTLHFYAATHTDALRNTMTVAIDAGLPVFVSEYGICDASGNGTIDEAQANIWVQVMDQYKVSYVAWNISNKNETSAIIKSTVEKTSGFLWEDLSDSGQWLYQILTKDKGKLPGKKEEDINETSDKKDISAAESGSLQSKGMETTVTLANCWESDGRQFYQYELTIKNTSDQPCQSWAVDVKFNGDISLSDSWNGRFVAEGDTLHVSSVDYNGGIDAGGSTDGMGFIVSSAAELEIQ